MRKHYPLNPGTGLEDASLLPWENGNPATGVEGSYPPAALFTDPEASILVAQGVAGLVAADDPTQLAQAIARGIYLGVFSGSTNGLTATIPGSTVFPSFVPGTRFTGVPAFTNTGAVSIAITGLTSTLTATQLLRRDGLALQPGDIVLGVPFGFSIDPSGNFRLANLGQAETPRVVASPTLFVRTDGADSNDGSANDASHAFATIAAAVAKGTSSFYLAGRSLVIQLGNAGTYAAPGNIDGGGATVRIVGDASNGSTISGVGPSGGGGALVAAVNGSVQLQSLTVSNSGAINANVAAVGAGNLSLQNVALQTSNAGAPALVLASSGGSVAIGSGCTMGGSASIMWSATGGTIVMTASVAIANNPVFSTAMYAAGSGGAFQLSAGGAGFSGTSATGQHYFAKMNASIDTNGSGANFFPGSTAGTTATGGQYA